MDEGSAGSDRGASGADAHRFQFTGQAREYFRIWIVNVLLSIVTLGIYSAWAKVRTKRYFYRHTRVDGVSFDYHADPIKILKGRAIIVVALGLSALSEYVSPALYAAVVVILVVLSPLVLVKALAFAARNTSYRNVRFGFRGEVKESYGVMLYTYAMQALTCGLGVAFGQWRRAQFIVQNHRWGTEPFFFRSTSSDYLKAYMRAFGLVLIGVVWFFVVVLSNTEMFQPSEPGAPPELPMTFYVVLVAGYAGMAIPAGYLSAHLFNLLYGGINVGPHRLDANLSGGTMIRIYVTNLLAIVVSLGLLAPWAMIRLARYRASHLTLTADGSLETHALAAGEGGAVGDAAADLGDFDLDLA